MEASERLWDCDVYFRRHSPPVHPWQYFFSATVFSYRLIITVRFVPFQLAQNQPFCQIEAVHTDFWLLLPLNPPKTETLIKSDTYARYQRQATVALIALLPSRSYLSLQKYPEQDRSALSGTWEKPGDYGKRYPSIASIMTVAFWISSCAFFSSIAYILP